MGARAVAVGRDFFSGYAGLGLYYAWVFISFNSSRVMGIDGRELSVMHVLSAVSAMAVFLGVIAGFRWLVQWSFRRAVLLLVVAGMVGAVGTLLFSWPPLASSVGCGELGAFMTGLGCSPVVLAWGAVYRRLEPRLMVLFTLLSFAEAALLYGLAEWAGQVGGSVMVSIMPLASALTVIGSVQRDFCGSDTRASHNMLRTFLVSEGEGRPSVGAVLPWHVFAGLAAALFSYGGLRVYLGDMAAGVFANGALMVLPMLLAVIVFCVYSVIASRTALNLGVLYRMTITIWTLAFMLLMLLEQGQDDIAFFAASLSSVLFEILTWAFLVETARAAHVSALPVFAAGRFAVHFGIIAGEVTAFFLAENVIGFAAIAVCALVVSAGFMFKDHDTTFTFEGSATNGPLRGGGPSEGFELVPDALTERARSGNSEWVAAALTKESERTASFETASVAGGRASGPEYKPEPSAVAEASVGSPFAYDESSAVSLVAAPDDLRQRIDALARRCHLSPREREVFALWVTGRGAKYIQERLVISPATVKTHLRHIYEKCGVHSRAELMKRLEEIQ